MGERRSWIALFLLCGVASLFVYLVVSRVVAPVALSGSGVHEEGFRVADFLFETSFTSAYWSGEIASPYVPSDQAQVLADLGSGGDVAVPFGMSPVSLVLLAPFAWLADSDFVTAYSLWVALSFAALLFALMTVYARLPRKPLRSRFLFVAGALVLIASRVGWRAIALADFVPLAVAGMLTVVCLAPNRDSGGGRATRYVLLAVAYLFSVWKVHYVGMAAALHFLLGRRTEAIAYGVGTTAAAIAIPTAFDPQLLASYFDELLHFSGQSYADGFARLGGATSGGSGATLRHALTDFVGAEAARISAIVVAAGTWISILVHDLVAGGGRPDGSGDFLTDRAPGAAARALLFLATFLVAMPYLGRYDDLFLVVALAIVSLFGRSLGWIVAGLVAGFGLVGSAYLPPPGLGGSALLILGSKLAALGGLFLLLVGSRPARGSPGRRSPTDRSQDPITERDRDSG